MKCQRSRRSRRVGGKGTLGKEAEKQKGNYNEKQKLGWKKKRQVKMFKDDERRSHWYKYG